MRTALTIALALGLTLVPSLAEAKIKTKAPKAAKIHAGKGGFAQDKTWKAAAKKRKAPKRKPTKRKGAN